MVVRALELGVVVEPASVDWLQEDTVAQIIIIVGRVMVWGLGMRRCSAAAMGWGADSMVEAGRKPTTFETMIDINCT